MARFLGRVHCNPGHVVNFIVLVCKQFLYAKKCLGVKAHFKELLKVIDRIEKYNAKEKGRLHYHQCKWAPYTGIAPSKPVHGATENSPENTEITTINYLMDHGVT